MRHLDSTPLRQTQAGLLRTVLRRVYPFRLFFVPSKGVFGEATAIRFGASLGTTGPVGAEAALKDFNAGFNYQLLTLLYCTSAKFQVNTSTRVNALRQVYHKQGTVLHFVNYSSVVLSSILVRTRYR
jgi:hypothetical protein